MIHRSYVMRNMVLLASLLIPFSLHSFGQTERAEDKAETMKHYPDFSWDRIPQYMHLRKATSYTKKEIGFIAKFPLITFEKANGHKEHGSVEEGTLISARAVKKLNPRAKILYYRNVIVHYSGYAADESLKEIPNAFLKNGKGNDKLVRGAVPAYDLSNAKVRDWWVENCKQMSSDPAIDGIFLDGSVKALEPNYLKRNIGVGKKQQTIDGYHLMMKEAREAIGEDALMVANILRARFKDGGLEYLDYFDGSYLENFSDAVGGVSREDYEVKGIDAMQKAARQGKIIAFTSSFKNSSKMGIDEAEQSQAALVYQLGMFLVCAEKYSYFRFHEGYSADRGDRWMRQFEEYNRPLGAPKGPAKKDGYVYTREFAHASVKLDLEKRTADITWLEPDTNVK